MRLLPILLLAAVALLPAEDGQPLKNAVTVRGQKQDIYYYRGAGSGAHPKVLFAPGDGGWRGAAISTAQSVAALGYDVYGFDTKHYLESFTGRRATLTAQTMGSDMVQVAQSVRGNAAGRVIFLGWSQGAGMAVLAASTPAGKSVLAGIVAMGLPKSTVLGWGLVDSLATLARREPNQPSFPTEPLMAMVSPVPLWIIHAKGDEYTSVEEIGRLFGAAREPKKLVLIDGGNHRFDGRREVFHASLKEGLSWIGNHSF